jgi:hypothetical protein
MKVLNKIFIISIINLLVLFIISYLFSYFTKSNDVFILCLILGGVTNLIILLLNVIILVRVQFKYLIFFLQFVAVALMFPFSIEMLFLYLLIFFNLLFFKIVINIED